MRCAAIFVKAGATRTEELNQKVFPHTVIIWRVVDAVPYVMFGIILPILSKSGVLVVVLFSEASRHIPKVLDVGKIGSAARRGD